MLLVFLLLLLLFLLWFRCFLILIAPHEFRNHFTSQFKILVFGFRRFSFRARHYIQLCTDGGFSNKSRRCKCRCNCRKSQKKNGRELHGEYRRRAAALKWNDIADQRSGHIRNFPGFFWMTLLLSLAAEDHFVCLSVDVLSPTLSRYRFCLSAWQLRDDTHNDERALFAAVTCFLTTFYP